MLLTGSGAAAGLQLNPPALDWAARRGLQVQDLLPAALALQPRAGPAVLGGSAGDWAVACTVVPMGEALLLWLQPAADTAADDLAAHRRLIAEALGVGFWSLDHATGQVHWDEQMFRIHGLDPADGPPPLARWLAECVHPLDQQRLAGVMGWVQPPRAQVPGSLVEASFRIRHPADGAQAGERWVRSWTRRPLPPARVSCGVHIDVTERQRAEQQAQHERQRTELAIEAAGLGVWERDLDGRVLHWNDAMYHLRGLQPDDPRSPEQIVADTTHPDDLQQQAQVREAHLLRGQPYRHEFRVRLPSGRWRWLGAEGRAVRDADGHPVAMSGVNFDVSERREAERLQQEAQRLEQAGREQSAFMARMSHELRTPMNAVLGFCRLLLEDGAEPPSARQRERLAHIDAAGQQLLALIDHLLQSAQVPTPPPSPPSGGGLRVLCVEDNPVNLQLVRELLALRPAMELRTAENGHDGISAATADPPDLLLLDLQLPDISGLDVMRQLRSLPALQRCRIVALSADAMPDHIQAALAAGFDDYWTKPIEFDRFLAGLDALAARRSQPLDA